MFWHFFWGVATFGGHYFHKFTGIVEWQHAPIKVEMNKGML